MLICVSPNTLVYLTPCAFVFVSPIRDSNPLNSGTVVTSNWLFSLLCTSSLSSSYITINMLKFMYWFNFKAYLLHPNIGCHFSNNSTCKDILALLFNSPKSYTFNYNQQFSCFYSQADCILHIIEL